MELEHRTPALQNEEINLADNLQIPIRYDLTRSERIVPHLRVWGPMSVILPILFIAVVAAAIFRFWWVSFALVPLLFIFRGFFVGLLNIALYRFQNMEIVIGNETLGFVVDGE